MKKLILTLAVLCIPFLLAANTEDQKAVKEVVQGAYIDGLQNLGDIQTIREGFHPDFEMLMLRNGQLSRMKIEPWISRVEQRKNNPNTTAPNITGKFIEVDVAGSVALVKLELHRDGKKIFTDFISLYKFPEGWKIVSKVYNQHQ